MQYPWEYGNGQESSNINLLRRMEFLGALEWIEVLKYISVRRIEYLGVLEWIGALNIPVKEDKYLGVL